MAIQAGGAVRSVQKLQGTISSQAYPQGSTVKTFPMPNFNVVDPTNSVMQNLWWRVVSGTLSNPISLFADVQAVGTITVVVNNPGASVTLSIEVGGTVVEYG